MFQPIRDLAASLPERIRARAGERAAGIVLALLMEALLVLALLTLGQASTQRKFVDMAMVSFDAAPDKAPVTPERAKPDPKPARPLQQPRVQPPTPIPPTLVPPAPAAPQLIQLSRKQMAAFDISGLPRQPSAPAPNKAQMGPADMGVAGDTKRVGGAGPNGEPLYAASWYREPYDDELSGYLSTADGPGWALIACRTVADFRVEDCIGLDEYPSGSRIQRSVLAAAWQFRVRPPRLGGVSKVGEWVRIRIDYDLRRN